MPGNLHTTHAPDTRNWIWDNASDDWIKQTAAAAGGGGVTIANGDDVAEGATTDVAWVSGAGTVISLLKKIASGGGSAVSIADGSDVAEGVTTDAAVVTDVSGTVSGKLRGLVKIFASVWDSINGRLKVDGSAVTQPVSAVSLPLPTGASTSALQTTGNTSVGSIDTKLTDGTQKTKLTDGNAGGGGDAAVVTRTGLALQPIDGFAGLVTYSEISRSLPFGTALIGHVIVDSGSESLTDGANGTVAVKAPSTAATAADIALVTRTVQLPTALAASGGLKIEGVASGTPIPISGSVTATLSPVDASGQSATDAYNLYRLEEKNYILALQMQVSAVLAEEPHTSQAMGYELR